MRDPTIGFIIYDDDSTVFCPVEETTMCERRMRMAFEERCMYIYNEYIAYDVWDETIFEL